MLRLLPFFLSLAIGLHAEAIRPSSLFIKNCQECHNPKKSKGKFSLSDLSGGVKAKNIDKWHDVLDQLESHEMPPEDQAPIAPQNRKLMLSWVKSKMAQYNASTPSQVKKPLTKRLTLDEYQHTLRDLLGVEHLGTNSPSQELLEDAYEDGFNNNAKNLSMSSYHMNAYLNTARKILDNFILDDQKPESKKYDFKPHYFKKVRWTTKGSPGNGKDHLDLIAPSHHQSIARFPEFPETGYYKITIDAQAIDRNYPYKEEHIGVHKSDPVKMSIKIGSKNFIQPLQDKRKTYTLNTWVSKGSDLGFGLDTDGLKMVLNGNFKFYGSLPKRYPEIHPGIKAEAKKYPNETTAKSNSWSWKYWRGPRVRIFGVKLEGPYYKSWPPEVETKLIGAKSSTQNIKTTLLEFAQKAYRREVSSKKILPIINYTHSLAKKTSTKEALKEGLTLILSSSPFLYINQKSSPQYSLASKLSYAIWSSTPDTLLMQLAKQNKLKSNANLDKLVRLMLKSPKSQAFIDNFPNAWFELNMLGFMPPDPDLYLYFHRKDLMIDMKNEVKTFFAHALKENLSLMDFIKADYSFINEDLAKIYGIANIKGSTLRKYHFKDGRRGGILGMGAILSLSSDTQVTSPIHRGVWLKENLFGSHPSPPPPELMIEEPDIRNSKNIREALAKHTSQADCRSCHAKIDHWGWAFENFGPAGEWRDHYVKIHAGKKGPISKKANIVDASSQLANGRKYEGIHDFKEIMESQDRKIVACFIRKLITYINGQEPGYEMDAEVDRLVALSRQQNYKIINTMIAVFQSPYIR
jgi:hypothetical protein